MQSLCQAAARSGREAVDEGEQGVRGIIERPEDSLERSDGEFLLGTRSEVAVPATGGLAPDETAVEKSAQEGEHRCVGSPTATETRLDLFDHKGLAGFQQYPQHFGFSGR